MTELRFLQSKEFQQELQSDCLQRLSLRSAVLIGHLARGQHFFGT